MRNGRQDATVAANEDERKTCVGISRPLRPEGDLSQDSTSDVRLGATETLAANELRATIAAQAARIEELSRAYGAIVEDNKAFRTRTERDKASVVAAARASMALALLETSDDLERAVVAAEVAGDSQTDLLRNVVKGARIALDAVQKRITEMGAERVLTCGLRFDPRCAEALDTIAVTDAAQDGVVLQEVRSGYRVGDRLLRPARVRVGRLVRSPCNAELP